MAVLHISGRTIREWFRCFRPYRGDHRCQVDSGIMSLGVSGNKKMKVEFTYILDGVYVTGASRQRKKN